MNTINTTNSQGATTLIVFPNVSCLIRIRGEAATDVPYITELSYITEPTNPPDLRHRRDHQGYSHLQ